MAPPTAYHAIFCSCPLALFLLLSSKITSASAEELLQVSEFGPLQMTITLTFEACLSP